MNNKQKKLCLLAVTSLATGLLGSMAYAQEGDLTEASYVNVDEIIVKQKRVFYTQSAVTKPMMELKTPLTSITDVVNSLPGVSVHEGDNFGFDDWSTTISIRGFQDSLDEQQIGITIDGVPNGNSNYGGGSKANRYIDSGNLAGVEVSQGTADIASRSHEALGGTLNFLTSDPEMERRMRFTATVGSFQARRFYGRYDTGAILNGTTYAWVSISHQEATDWVNGSADNHRDNAEAKFISDLGALNLTGYFSYDDTLENNYQRLFTEADYKMDPHWDQLTAEWTGIPYIDQLYRKGWGTLRTNTLAYLKADGKVTDDLTLSGTVYYHDNNGRGDWVPPYLVDALDDGTGNPESEFLGTANVLGTPLYVKNGEPLRSFTFVDANGVALAPMDGCQSSIFFPYASVDHPASVAYDPSCYPAGAVAVQSYRHTNYWKERYGAFADFDWDAMLGDVENEMRGGVWYEDNVRRETRTWHKIIDTRIGYEFNDAPYWTQYSRKYPQTTFKWYVQDSVTFGPVTATAGVKQFLVDVSRVDIFGESSDVSINSDSDLLLSGGLVYRTPLEGAELFAGYSENFSALGDEILERPNSDLTNLKPQTAENIEVGARYTGDRLSGTLTYYDISFDNRIIFLDNETTAGPNYLIGTNGTYFNAGGIKSHGVEASLRYQVLDSLSLYGSYTHNDSTYIGTGDPAVDKAVGITPGNTVVGTPKDMFVVAADWMDGPYRAGISAKHTGDRFITFDNSWVADAYTTVDLYVGATGEAISDSLKNVDFSITVQNAFDVSYKGGISGQGFWIGAPRTAALTLKADF